MQRTHYRKRGVYDVAITEILVSETHQTDHGKPDSQYKVGLTEAEICLDVLLTASFSKTLMSSVQDCHT